MTCIDLACELHAACCWVEWTRSCCSCISTAPFFPYFVCAWTCLLSRRPGRQTSESTIKGHLLPSLAPGSKPVPDPRSKLPVQAFFWKRLRVPISVVHPYDQQLISQRAPPCREILEFLALGRQDLLVGMMATVRDGSLGVVHPNCVKEATEFCTLQGHFADPQWFKRKE